MEPSKLELAGHLLRRATFGFSHAQLQQAVADGHEKTVDRLLAVPPEAAAFEQGVRTLIPPEATSQDSGEVWLYRMRNSPYPLLEKATLFSYDFFGVAGSRVAKSGLMERHLQLLRKHALGRFDELLMEVAHDPATLLAVGPPAGLDTEAFSGVTVLRGEYHYQASQHHGKLTPEEAVRKALGQPELALAVVRRMTRWLLGETSPQTPELASLAASFARDYDTGKLVSGVLRSQAFQSREAYRQSVKSPVEFALNLAIALDVPVAPGQLHPQLAGLGQRLPDVPSRDGWAGGRRWLNAYTIIGRSKLAAGMLAKVEHYPDRAALLETLLQNDVPPAILPGLSRFEGRELAQTIVNLPEFQLA